MSLLEVENLWVRFPIRQGIFDAVRGVSFALERERLGIVGESGSGKSMTGRAILRLIRKPGIVEADAIRLEGRNLLELSEPEMRKVRGQKISMVMQDPKFSLNPVMTIGDQIMESYLLHNNTSKAQARAKATALLERVGLAERITHYPNQLSGGEQQRVAIARAFATEAKILFADEPTGNLDTATGAKIVELIFDLNKEFSTTLVLVTHDERLAQRCGRIVRLIAGEIESDSGSPQGAASNNANASESTESASA